MSKASMIPNATTLQAMKDAKTSRTVKGFKKVEDMFKSLKEFDVNEAKRIKE